MNDFFIASNRSLKLSAGDVDLEVRQITMKDFDLWLVASSEIKTSLKNIEVYSDEILKKIVSQFEVQCYSIINLVTDLDIDSIIKTKINNLDIFIELVKKTLEANHAYFYEKTVKRNRRAQQSENAESWFDSLQLLVTAGHPHESIMNMSYGTYKHYLDAAVKAYKRNIATQAGIVRVAQHAAAKEFKKYLDDIKPD
ncbi:hypothetical protein [Acinetobacter guerrae]|uniref:hypothetical protein n=1 Tax=Acinetobacter guerrae TaxID=1843371 RepID=UPI00128E53DA|nr:hypothetical protein [Acinetobacter guerrae]MPW43374.1 hypothetical protein [Acinetobacter guerrae]